MSDLEASSNSFEAMINDLRSLKYLFELNVQFITIESPILIVKFLINNE